MNIELLRGYILDSVLEQIPDTYQLGVDGPKRLSHLLGECKHESGQFTTVVENLNYSAQGLANTWPKRYAVDPRASIKIPNDIARSLHKKPEAIANLTYANRNGNGDVQSGDGWKHRGYGYLQTTGKKNQQDFFISIGLPADSDPALIGSKYPLASAAFFFKDNKLWTTCDQGVTEDICKIICKRVNGGYLGLEERTKYTQEFYNILTKSK